MPRFTGVRGSLFKIATHRSPELVTAPISENRRPRAGTEEVLVVWHLTRWGCRHEVQKIGAVPQPTNKWWRP